MIIPTFHNAQEFDDFCYNLTCEEVRKLTAVEWNNLYYEIDKLRHSKIFYTPSQMFVKKHQKSFEKLYSNFRLEAKYAQYVKILAQKAAHRFIQTEPNIEKKYLSSEVLFWETLEEQKRISKSLTKSIYDVVYDSPFCKTILYPNIRIIPKKNLRTSGYFNNSGFWSKIRLVESVRYMTCAAHESFHSLQLQGGVIQKLLVKTQKPADALKSAELKKLYNNNLRYYLKCKDRRLVPIYSKQPLEYGANLFECLFARRVREHIQSANKNFGQVEYVSQVIRAFECFEAGASYSKTSISFQYCNLPQHLAARLKELNQRYIKGTLTQDNNQALILTIDTDLETKLRIQRVLKNLKQCRSADLVKTFLPESFEREKRIFSKSNLKPKGTSSLQLFLKNLCR